MNILEHLKPTKIVDLSVSGVDVSISTSVIIMFLAAAAVFFFYFIVSRKPRLVPKGPQSIAEYVIEFVRTEMLSPLGADADIWVPFIVTLFSFIFVCNLSGLIPGFVPPTSNINVTATLAVLVFLLTQIVGVIKRGPLGYIKSLIPSGLPLPVQIFLFPIEIIGQFARPFSLSVRLFANMFAGHTVIMMLISLIFVFKNYFVIPLPVLGSVLVSLFEIFVALIQAFIFSYLSSSYIIGALQTEH